ncbi:MAG: DUF1223 domain-containing protein [Rhodobacterales bacterium]|nr:DUF1223 domain-containing protein [Rhodobacterales bacterium]NCT11986.1 DUF1223 domain-containing protein [Rhodobacterales bacterium]
MRATFAALCLICGLALAGGGAVAQTSPVVVELFTSQGCSSCPPADELLHELAAREDVIALALHVDYWDYIGWADAFARPQFTRRQQGYAMIAGAHMVYTPQMVIGGTDHVAGADRPAVLAQLRRHAAAVSDVRLDLRREGGALVIAAEAGAARPMVVQLVRYVPEQTVEIGAGENIGRHISYANIVTSWEVLTLWTGQAPLALRTATAGDGPVVVIIQAEGPGPVLAAARLD